MKVEEETCSTSSAYVLQRLSSAKIHKTDVEYKSGARRGLCVKNDEFSIAFQNGLAVADLGYQGEVSGIQRSGSGIFTWANGSCYEGEFVNNKRHGRGIQTWPDGSRYEGNFVDDCKHGDGRHAWPSGEEYAGSFFKDHRHGCGTYMWPNGNKYVGTFYMDKKEGYGTFTFTNGSCFQGLYKNDEREGPGIMSYSDGTRDVGLWHRERLIRLCTELAEVKLDLKSHGFHVNPEEYKQKLPAVVKIRQRIDRLGSASVLPAKLREPLCYGYEPPVDSICRAIVSDTLPASCLAADIQSYDEVFFAAAANQQSSQSPCQAGSFDNDAESKPNNKSCSSEIFSCSSSQGSTEGGVVAWNNTLSSISMQMHVLRHSQGQRSVNFDVNTILCGRRCGPDGDCGPIENASKQLILAAFSGDKNVVVELIDSNDVNVDVADCAGCTALFAATINCHTDIINYLLDNGADINKLTDEGLSALAACFIYLYPPDKFLENAAIDCSPAQQVDPSEVNANPLSKNSKTSKNAKKKSVAQASLSKADAKKIRELRSQYANAVDELKDQPVEPAEEFLTENNNITNRSDSIKRRDSWLHGTEQPVSVVEFDSGKPVNELNVAVSNQQIERCATILSTNEMIVSRQRSANHKVWSEGTVRCLALEKSRWKQMKSTMQLLLKRGANPNISSVPMPVLLFAVRSGDVEVVRLLLSSGANAGAKTIAGLVPLHFSCGLDGEEGIHITQLLLDSLADPDARAEVDDSYLNHFLEEEWSKDLIDADSLAVLGGRTPLHVACCRQTNRQNVCEVVRVLLKHRANPQVLCNGHSPLTLAITRGSDGAVKLLLDAGADTNLIHTHGIGSPLCTATFMENEPIRQPEARIELIDQLLDAGANILAPIAVGQRRQLGTVVDYAYYIYNLILAVKGGTPADDVDEDQRVAHVPYHALTPTERETYNARRQLLEHLGHRLREKAVEIERERIKRDEQTGTPSRNPSANFLYTGHGARVDSANLIRKPPHSAASHSSAAAADLDVRRPLFRYCYECGRTINVRLTPCPRCKEVLYCSKPCLNKAWATIHREECLRLPQDDKRKTAHSASKDKDLHAAAGAVSKGETRIFLSSYNDADDNMSRMSENDDVERSFDKRSRGKTKLSTKDTAIKSKLRDAERYFSYEDIVVAGSGDTSDSDVSDGENGQPDGRLSDAEAGTLSFLPSKVLRKGNNQFLKVKSKLRKPKKKSVVDADTGDEAKLDDSDLLANDEVQLAVTHDRKQSRRRSKRKREKEGIYDEVIDANEYVEQTRNRKEKTGEKQHVKRTMVEHGELSSKPETVSHEKARRQLMKNSREKFGVDYIEKDMSDLNIEAKMNRRLKTMRDKPPYAPENRSTKQKLTTADDGRLVQRTKDKVRASDGYAQHQKVAEGQQRNRNGKHIAGGKQQPLDDAGTMRAIKATKLTKNIPKLIKVKSAMEVITMPAWKDGLPANCYIGNYSFV